jgi:hypothetical protein
MTTLNWKRIAEIAGGVLFAVLLVWFFFLRSPGLEPADTAPQQTFGQAGVQTDADAENAEGDIAGTIASPISKQKIFKISDGPVAGATFMQDGRPTTTMARFVMQQNGHAFDLAIDSPGSVARAASNTTIPGAHQVVWEMQTAASRQVAAGAVLQYVDSGVIKTVALIFPQASTTASSSVRAPVRVQFLSDNIRSLASSPDGLSLAYLVGTQTGSDGYVARYDGTNPRKLFSLPLSQVTISWPSGGVILAVSKPATGVPGIAFSVNTTSGAVSPILYAQGLTATADLGFNHVVYQSATTESRLSFTHDTKSNIDRTLSFDPIPEKCVWSRLEASLMYCAVPLSYTAPSYVDLWHKGASSAADSVVAYNLLTGQTTIMATPGGTEGGVASDIMQMALSADEKYLLYVSKGTRSLWGVRLRDF